MPTRVAVYARVSTSEQHPEAQLEPLRAYAAARGLEIVGEYVDHGVSGAKARRPALDRLLADARRRRFDAVACVKLDRLARSVHHLTALGQELAALGVDLIVLDQAIDTSTPAGKLLFHVLGSIAEFERDLIRERTCAGMAAAKRRGARFGQPRKLRGVTDLRLEQMLASGRSLRSIARELGCAAATVAREATRLGLHRAA
jgi:DNA invertase Pin-like site-specific DNA recombinase